MLDASQVTAGQLDTMAIVQRIIEIAVLGLLGFVGWTLREALKDIRLFREELLTLRLVLTGENGVEGVKGNVAILTRAKHRIDNNISALAGAITITRLEAKLEPLELKLRTSEEDRS